ncbi:Ubiquitin-conjugating enzyme E2 J1 [Heterocephalus glaber]|uniref:Ubiquitin-conjugating enzyme E2 J1 n=1 Tax=Heterocephalus glaber TaxID=10181 RepID=G5B9C9_HETGA|nr:Ubiquitin-conjugating enzyme E2 J1 [Heterocephalus glaber]
METRYNLKSPAVKRLMREAAELKDPTDHYHAQPLEDNLFEWHFTGAMASTSYGVQNPSAASFQQLTQPAAKNTSMSPRQHRAQQQNQRRSSMSPDVIQGQQPRDNHMDHGGSGILIVILTLALAALIFRRMYMANEYIFDFEL